MSELSRMPAMNFCAADGRRASSVVNLSCDRVAACQPYHSADRRPRNEASALSGCPLYFHTRGHISPKCVKCKSPESQLSLIYRVHLGRSSAGNAIGMRLAIEGRGPVTPRYTNYPQDDLSTT